MFCFTIWLLLEVRGARLFQYKCTKCEHLLKRIKSHVGELTADKAWSFHTSEKAIAKNLSIPWSQKRMQSRTPITWSMPLPRHFKFNINRASYQNPGFTGCGDVVRNDGGDFIVVFTKPLGTSHNYAEFYSLEVGVLIKTK
ncbi:hypothetical protein AMTRI_Chr06g195980 [Amborella trichopoda]